MSEEGQTTEGHGNLLPAGTYRAKATDWKLGFTEKQDPQLGINFEILQDGPYKGWNTSKFLYFTEKTFDRTIESLRYLGWTGEDMDELQNRGGGLDKNEVSIVVEHETYEGKTRAKVSWINRVGGVVMNRAMAPEDVVSFAAKIKQKIRAADIRRQASEKSRGQPMQAPAPEPNRAPVQPPKPEGMNDDDIPF